MDIVGEDVKLTQPYLRQSLNVLIEFASLLSFSLFRKFAREDEDQAFTNLNEAIFKLIQRGHYIVSERLAAYALGLKKVNIKEETRLMLIVNRASAVRHSGREDEAKSILDGEDWSAVSDLFKFCVSAVRGDSDQFIAMLPAMKASGSITAHAILTWPCFSFMRQIDRAQEALNREFDLSPPKKDTSQGSIEQIEGAAEGGSGPVP